MRAFYLHRKNNPEIKDSLASEHQSHNDSIISTDMKRDNDVANVVVTQNQIKQDRGIARREDQIER